MLMKCLYVLILLVFASPDLSGDELNSNQNRVVMVPSTSLIQLFERIKDKNPSASDIAIVMPRYMSGYYSVFLHHISGEKIPDKAEGLSLSWFNFGMDDARKYLSTLKPREFDASTLRKFGFIETTRTGTYMGDNTFYCDDKSEHRARLFLIESDRIEINKKLDTVWNSSNKFLGNVTIVGWVSPVSRYQFFPDLGCEFESAIFVTDVIYR